MKENPQITIRRLIEKAQPRPIEMKRVLSHSDTVKRRLNKSFDLKRFVKFGSHSRETAIRGYSDMDYIAVLARNNAKWGGNIVNSSTVLKKVRDDLDDRFTHTLVKRDMQAVVVNFGNGQHSMDVVPAIFSRFHCSRPVYWIPDGSDGWIETCPEAHNKFFLDSQKKYGARLSKLLQLLKWWKFSRSEPIPISSFHLDLLLASSDVVKGIKPYTRCLHDAFQLLVERDCRGLRDPVGIAGIISAADTQAKLEKVYTAAEYALQHAKAAIQAEAWKDFEEANRQWSIVFNGTL